MNGSRLIAIVAVLSICSCGGNKGTFAVVNKASEPIARASVTICDQSQTLGEIEPGHSAGGCYVVRGDDHYVIEIKFRSGKTLRKEVGYVTSGFDFQDEITVTDSDIELNSKGLSKYSSD